MSFEKFTDRHSRSDLGDPKMTISSSEGGQVRCYLNSAAVRRWLDGAYQVIIHVDTEHSKLAFERTNKHDEDGYSLQIKGGADIGIDAALGSFDISAKSLDGSWKFDLEKDGGLIIADISELVEDVTGDVHCPECDRRFTESGIKVHLTREHDEDWAGRLEEMDPDEIGEPAPEGDDSWQEMYDEGGETA